MEFIVAAAVIALAAAAGFGAIVAFVDGWRVLLCRFLILGSALPSTWYSLYAIRAAAAVPGPGGGMARHNDRHSCRAPGSAEHVGTDRADRGGRRTSTVSRTGPSTWPNHACCLRNVCTSDRGAGGRGGGRFTREGAPKADSEARSWLGQARVPVACFGVPSRVGAPSPDPQRHAPGCAEVP